METSIKETVLYFNYFSYAPSLREINKYLTQHITIDELSKKLTELAQNQQLEHKIIEKTPRYTIQGYSSLFSNYAVRKVYSELKLKKIKSFIFIINLFPQIKLAGLSGSVAMNNAKKDDDIDLFIITAKDRLWTARIICLILAQFVGLRRKRGLFTAKDKICLNLFFEESELLVPKYKRNFYVAHEILQMKPLIIKDDIYNKFIRINKWIFDLFPNCLDMLRYGHNPSFTTPSRDYGGTGTVLRKIGDCLESFLKMIQNYYIKRHKTTELLLQKQLWFHPDDFEKKVEKFIT